MNDKEKRILEKSEHILKINTYPANEFPWGKYRMISPGRDNFVGIWNWDSAFHAAAMLEFDDQLAKEQILGFFQYQKENGMLPDVIWENGEIYDGWTKPPVMATAAELVYKKTGDKDFLNEIYPKLVLNEKFWRTLRFKDGLFKYDSDRSLAKDEKEYFLHVGYESGWDNSPRWDNMPQFFWPIDLNCYMVMTYRSMSFLAKEAGDDAKQWNDKEKELISNIESRLWNEKMQSYTDFNFKDDKFCDVLTPASFMPLYVGFAPKNRAEAMNKIAEEHFLPGMPTVAYDNPDYTDEDYWRGPCWLNTAFFAAKGLKNYGFEKNAQIIRNTIIDWVDKDGDCIHENYDAKTGKGLCYPYFSWSSYFIRKFIFDI